MGFLGGGTDPWFQLIRHWARIHGNNFWRKLPSDSGVKRSRHQRRASSSLVVSFFLLSLQPSPSMLPEYPMEVWDTLTTMSKNRIHQFKLGCVPGFLKLARVPAKLSVASLPPWRCAGPVVTITHEVNLAVSYILWSFHSFPHIGSNVMVSAWFVSWCKSPHLTVEKLGKTDFRNCCRACRKPPYISISAQFLRSFKNQLGARRHKFVRTFPARKRIFVVSTSLVQYAHGWTHGEVSGNAAEKVDTAECQRSWQPMVA